MQCADGLSNETGMCTKQACIGPGNILQSCIARCFALERLEDVLHQACADALQKIEWRVAMQTPLSSADFFKKIDNEWHSRSQLD